MINLKENLYNFFALNKVENMDTSGNKAMTLMGLEIDHLFDYAADKFYPLDCFVLEMDPVNLKLLPKELIIDEAMWFKNDATEEPLHETIGLNPIYDDCKVVQLTSGITLHDEAFNFVKLYQLIQEQMGEAKVILSIPLLNDDFYQVRFNKGKVSTSKNNLHRVRSDDLRLLAYQMMVLAGDEPLAKVIELLAF